jgi:hypothetical protein
MLSIQHIHKQHHQNENTTFSYNISQLHHIQFYRKLETNTMTPTISQHCSHTTPAKNNFEKNPKQSTMHITNAYTHIQYSSHSYNINIPDNKFNNH